jgi:hypothetical protein
VQGFRHRIGKMYFGPQIEMGLGTCHMSMMDKLIFSSFAEMFIAKGQNTRRSPVTYRRFESAAEAVRFGIEELPPAFLAATILEVDGQRFGRRQIQLLYDRPDYPLTRRARSRAAATD